MKNINRYGYDEAKGEQIRIPEAGWVILQEGEQITIPGYVHRKIYYVGKGWVDCAVATGITASIVYFDKALVDFWLERLQIRAMAIQRTDYVRLTDSLRLPDKLKQAAKPPLGVIPQFIHEEKRAKELAEAIARYVGEDRIYGDRHKLLLDWITELKEVLDRLQNIHH